MESKSTLTREQRQIKRFIEIAGRILVSHYTFTELQRVETISDLLTRSAPAFFSDLNEILIREFYLEAAKLTDPVKSQGKYNLTVSTIVGQSSWNQQQQSILTDFKIKLEGFRPYIVEARNKVIAHNDLGTYEDDEKDTLSGFNVGVDIEFIATLEEFCNYIHLESFGHIWGKFIPSTPGDVQDLIADLYHAQVFDEVVNDPLVSNEMKMDLLTRALSLKGQIQPKT